MTFKNNLSRIIEKKKREDFNTDDEYSNYKHSTPIIFGFGVLIYILLLLLFAVLWDQHFPTVSLDESRFSVNNAVEFNEKMIKLGPRVVGSDANQIHAVELLKNKINTIISEKHENQDIEFDEQKVDEGIYSIHGYNVINAYRGVTNIIARVNSDSSKTTLLVNAHYDSVVESPGGSDDGIMCSVMIEVLRILSQSEDRPKYNIVFLFNGAEETMLQAAHGFITQHDWAENIVAVINLEASGVGEREMLFQSGPRQPWLLKYYSQVPYPHAQVAGEEVFQSNLIPSDTDFRIFRDFGNVVGFDLAYTRNGYRYHTKYDGGEIDLHTYKHTGENVLSLIESLANAPEMDNIEESDVNAVFYDFMGLFLIYYDRDGELAINLVTTIAAILCFAKYIYDYKLYNVSGIKYIGITLCGLLMGHILSLGFVILVGVILDALDFSMRWYKSVWLILGLYCAPIIAIQLTSLILLNKYNKPESFTFGMQAQFQIQLNNIVWAIIIFAGTMAEIRSVYIFLYHVLFTTAAFIIIQLAKKFTSYSWKYIYLVALFIPTLFCFQITLELVLLFIPICGRNGGGSNPEFMVALICFLLCTLATCYYVPLITTMRNSLYLVYFLILSFVVFIILAFTPITYPYGIDGTIAPQRYSVSHTSRIIRDENNNILKQDNGFTFINSDRNSPVAIRDYVKEIETSNTLEEDCKLALYCGVATTDSRSTKKLARSIWMPSGEIAENNPKVIVEMKNKISTPEKLEFDFAITGPDRMNIYLAVHKGITLTSLNTIDDVPKSVMEWNGKDVYYMNYIHGNDPVVPWSLKLKFDVSLNTIDYNFIHIAVTGKYVHDFQKSPEFEEFLEQFPDWVALSPWVTTYESWSY